MHQLSYNILLHIAVQHQDCSEHLVQMVIINRQWIEAAKDRPVYKMSKQSNELGHLFRLNHLKSEIKLRLCKVRAQVMETLAVKNPLKIPTRYLLRFQKLMVQDIWIHQLCLLKIDLIGL